MRDEEIVSAVAFHDSIYIFCRHGNVYEMRIDELTKQPVFRLIYS